MKIHLKIILILLVFSLIGCTPAMYDASFKGKVIDVDTKEPIEGAVALAIWTSYLLGAGGEITNYYDAYETITDKDGNFYIPGKGPRVATNLNPMQVNVYKAGYGGSSGTVKSYSRYSLNTNSQDGRLTIALKKLTMEQRKRERSMAAPPDEAPLDKVKNFLIEIDIDRIERGYSPRRKWHGEVYLDDETIKKYEPQIHSSKTINTEQIQPFSDPCRLSYKVYQENGEWKVALPMGEYLLPPVDNRPECVEKQKEMERLYKKHILNKNDN